MKLYKFKAIGIFFLFKILTGSLFGQSFQTYRQFGGEGNDKIFEIKVLPDGSFVAAGSFNNEIELGSNQFTALGREDLWIARFNSDLEIIWALAGGSSNQDQVTDLQVGPDGSIYWTGSFWQKAFFGNLELTPTLSNKSVFILKMDINGQILESTTLSGKGAKDVNETAIDNDSNIFLVGNFSDTLFHADTFFVSNYNGNYFTSKMNSTLEIEWFQQVEGDGFSNGNTLTLLPSGEIISAGEFQGTMSLQNDSIETGSSDEDVFFAKFSQEGVPIFLKKAGGVFPSFCKKAVSDSEGNFYLSGHHKGVINLDENIQIQTNGLNDNFYVLAYQNDGSAIWGKSYGSAENSEMTDLQLFENQLFITGFYNADMEIDSQIIPLGDGFFNAFFGGFSKLNGSLNWIQTTTGNESQAGRCIAPLSATEVMGGFDFSKEVSFENDIFSTNGFFDFFVTKMSTPLPSSSRNPTNIQFSIFPIPAENHLNLETDLSNFQIEIFSNFGKLIRQFSNQQKLDISFLPKGVYFLKIIDREGISSTKKFVKF